MSDAISPVGERSSVEEGRNLERGLALLRAMNATPNASVTTLARGVNLPRSTVYRLLATLERLGYVGRTAGTNGFRLRHTVRALSEGYLDDDWLEAAWPHVVAAGRRLVWPLSLFTFDVDSMVIRRTTHDQSVLSIDYGMIGRRMPVTASAAGRAYLAFCPAEEREWLLAQPAIAKEIERPGARDLLEGRLAEAVRDGYATRVGGLMPKTSSLSTPIMRGPRVLCCISVIWIRSGLPLGQAISKLAGSMTDLAATVTDIASGNNNGP